MPPEQASPKEFDEDEGGQLGFMDDEIEGEDSDEDTSYFGPRKDESGQLEFDFDNNTENKSIKAQTR